MMKVKKAETTARGLSLTCYCPKCSHEFEVCCEY